MVSGFWPRRGRREWSIQSGDAQYNMPVAAGAVSDRVQAGFAGPDADGFLDVGDEDLAVADAPGLGGPADGVDGFLHEVVGDHDLDFDLGQKIHDVFGAAVQFGVTLLAAEPLGLGDGDALQSDFLKRFFYLVELERLDDGFDFFH